VEKPYISVIIPAYNAAHTIKTTLNSVCAQNMDCVQIIVVDDGSLDNTYRIATEIAQRSLQGKTFIIVKQENRGVSAARNRGLDLAKGKYIFFLDSDDLLEPDCLSELFKEAEVTHSEIVMCGFDEVAENGTVLAPFEQHYKFPDKGIDGKRLLKLLLKKSTKIWTSSAIYSSFLIKRSRLRFTEGAKFGEDQEFIFKAVFNSFRTSCLEKTLSHYVIRNHSAMRRKELSHFHYVASMLRVHNYLVKSRSSEEILSLIRKSKIPEAYMDVFAILVRGGDNIELLNILHRNKAIRKQISNASIMVDSRIWLKSVLLLYAPKIMYSFWRKTNQ
jgi:glycosyltransferase involved in cell wall biosynthesis